MPFGVVGVNQVLEIRPSAATPDRRRRIVVRCLRLREFVQRGCRRGLRGG